MKNNIKNSIKKFLSSNKSKWRLARTIFQGVVGVVIAYIDVIVGAAPFIDQPLRPMIVALVMAVLSPLMAEMGGGDAEDAEDE